MKLLIAGICGFVGSSIVNRLQESLEGIEIVGVDNLIRPGSERNRVPLKQKGVRFFHADVRSASDLAGLPRCDWVIDAAANPSLLAGVDGHSTSRQVVQHNLCGTLELLEVCKSWKAGMILLSTSRVYSLKDLSRIPVKVVNDAMEWEVANGVGISQHGISESFSTEPPLSLYGSTKRASEILALEYASTFDLKVIVNRCGILAGAGQFGKIDQGLFSWWIHAWKRKRPLRYIGYEGKGYQVRDCLHPEDLADLLVKQIQSSSGPTATTANVSGGTGNGISLRNLSRWCESRMGAHTVIPDPTPRPFDVPRLVLDSRLAESTWGWRARRDLNSILEEIAEHAEQHPDWLETVTNE